MENYFAFIIKVIIYLRNQLFKIMAKQNDPKPKAKMKPGTGPLKPVKKNSVDPYKYSTKGPVTPTVRKTKEVADKKMNQSLEKKARAKVQENIGKAFQSKGKESAEELSKNVGRIKDMGKVLSNKQRIDLAKKLRSEAKKDSLEAVSYRKPKK